MTQQAKRDLVAALSVALMYAGSLILLSSRLGFALIGAGLTAMVMVFLVMLRDTK